MQRTKLLKIPFVELLVACLVILLPLANSPGLMFGIQTTKSFGSLNSLLALAAFFPSVSYFGIENPNSNQVHRFVDCGFCCLVEPIYFFKKTSILYASLGCKIRKKCLGLLFYFGILNKLKFNLKKYKNEKKIISIICNDKFYCLCLC